MNKDLFNETDDREFSLKPVVEWQGASFGIDDILGDCFGKRKLFEYEDLSDEGDLSEHIRSDSNDSAIYATSEGPSKNSDKGTSFL